MRVVVLAERSRTKTSFIPFPSPATRFVAAEQKQTSVLSAEIVPL